MNDVELRDLFIKGAEFVINSELEAANGTRQLDLKDVDIPSYLRVWDVAKVIILNANNLKKIEAKSASDITNALSKGKISADDAVKLMTMLKLKSDVEELPKLLDQLSEIKK